MNNALFLAFFLCQFFVTNLAFGQINAFPYSQSFEESFATGTHLHFLPHWWGNEVGRDSRIFSTTAAAWQGSAALAAEPTSTFSAEIRLLLDTRSLPAAQLRFWAASAKNGSGTRPSELLLSFSADGGGSFSPPEVVGGAAFANADSDFQAYSFSLPPALLGNANAVIRWQVRRSEAGSGTAARILLDEVKVETAAPQLELLSVSPLSATALLLHFNMAVEKASAQNKGNYKLQPSVPISGASLQENPAQVLLELASLAPGPYALTLSGVRPAAGGDPLPETTISFNFQPLPGFRDVVINEIFADPNPKGAVQPQPVLLPTSADAEFVELFNASATAYPLQALRLNGATPEDFLLEPGAYVTLVPAGNEPLYQVYGPVVGVKGWKGLSNSGSRLELRHAGSNTLLDSLSYDGAWYGESAKQEGGWSLEQVNPYLRCSQPGNWHASKDAKGATPATPNSIFDSTPDVRPPQLLEAVAADSQRLVIFFDEFIEPGSLTATQLRLEPAVPIAGLRHRGQQLLVQLATPLADQTSYHVQLQNFSDCSGNRASATAPIMHVAPAKAGEIVINEIMYDPETGQAEWVELHNPTNQYLNLQGWYLGLQEGKLKASVKLSENLLLMQPGSFLVLSSQPEAIREAYPLLPPKSLLGLSRLPALRNSGDTLVLLDSQARVAELIAYSDKLHHPLIKNSKGVSLERIDPAQKGVSASYWTSAAAPSWGTPGLQNSQFRKLETTAEALRISPDVLEPSPDGIADVALIHYQLPRPGLNGTLYIFDASGREIMRLANNQLLSQQGVWQWNGTNSFGERVRNGYYVVVLSVFGTDGFKEKWRKTMVVSNWL